VVKVAAVVDSEMRRVPGLVELDGLGGRAFPGSGGGGGGGLGLLESVGEQLRACHVLGLLCLPSRVGAIAVDVELRMV
jgi:hypothetical protein